MRGRHLMRLSAGALALVAACADPPRSGGEQAAEAASHAHPPASGYQLGTVRFPVSCSPAAGQAFERGVALLHSFWFAEARESFRSAALADPTCAMAHWGEALTWLENPFAGVQLAEPNLRGGLAAAEQALAAEPPTPRERGYVEAVIELYRSPEARDGRERRRAYEEAMKRVRDANPGDAEAVIFYALAVMSNAPPDDLTYARQKEGAALLEPLFREQPDHPGLAHYLIHAYDSPSLARFALDAARRYAEIAPSAPHALHMPSHIFTRLGYWDESLEMNRRSVEAEESLSGRFHPWDYMVYAYLQQGRDREADAVLQQALRISERATSPAIYSVYNLMAMPVRYAVERGRWDEAAALVVHPAPGSPWTEALTSFARGIGAARSGRLAVAREEAAALGRLEEDALQLGEAYWATTIQAQRLAVESWVAQGEGRSAEALGLARQAAVVEESVEKHPTTPGPIVPARELEGDLLLEMGRPDEALAAYEATLVREPNRARALFGAGRAAELAGDTGTAGKRYGELVALMSAANGDRPELSAARAYLARR